MKAILRRIRNAFTIRTHTRGLDAGELESRRREADRATVAKYSHGNIRLQNGRFLTRDDIERERVRAAKYEL